MNSVLGGSRRRLGAALVALILIGAAAAVVAVMLTDSSDGEPTALTQEQAQLLAMVRFSNYQAKTGSFEATVPVQGEPVALRGAVDWRRHVGVAAMQAPGGTVQGANGLVQWSLSTVGFRPGMTGDEPPPRLPRRGWSHRELSPESPVDTVLALLLNLAIDRPENPQLLSQNGAVKLEDEVIDGTPVQVLSGPRQPGSSEAEADEPRLRYWVDEAGRLRRLEARIGEASEMATIDLDPSGDQDVEVTPELPVPEAKGGKDSVAP